MRAPVLSEGSPKFDQDGEQIDSNHRLIAGWGLRDCGVLTLWSLCVYVHAWFRCGLRMGFSAEVACFSSIRGLQIPPEHSEFGIAASHDEPVIWGSDPAAEFASKFPKGGHALHLAS
jgi:hypothetical protein